MERNFKIKGFIARFRKVKNGYTIALGEPALNKLTRPTYAWLAIWGKKAKAIEPRLRIGRTFEFSGTIGINKKDGRTYLNYTIDTWLEMKPKPWNPPKNRQPRDDDWYTPSCRRQTNRRYEGFPGG